MPGGSKYRQWYAMRQRLITEGRWTTTKRNIRVPPAKQPRLEDEQSDTEPKTPDSMPELESSDSDPEGMFSSCIFQMSSTNWSGPTGFTLLLWSVDKPEDYTDEKDVLLDAIALLSGRWGLEFDFIERENRLYASTTCSRFSIGIATIEKALGDLHPNYISFHKGPLTSTVDALIRFQRCKEKWNVADVLSADSDDTRGPNTTSFWKRKKM